MVRFRPFAAGRGRTCAHSAGWSKHRLRCPGNQIGPRGHDDPTLWLAEGFCLTKMCHVPIVASLTPPRARDGRKNVKPGLWLCRVRPPRQATALLLSPHSTSSNLLRASPCTKGWLDHLQVCWRPYGSQWTAFGALNEATELGTAPFGASLCARCRRALLHSSCGTECTTCRHARHRWALKRTRSSRSEIDTAWETPSYSYETLYEV